MGDRFQFRPYKRRFLRPLATHHGTWETREGIILRLTKKTGQIGWGEIAPLPWFGSETLAQALAFCHQLPEEITAEEILSIPATLPACQFGFESAFQSLVPSSQSPVLPYSGLLPAGDAALQTWQPLWHQGYRTFKWKIGVLPLAEELQVFTKLLEVIPTSAKLRLDANGGLDWQKAKRWLQECDRSNRIEFLEQPLAVDQLDAMRELSFQHFTPIALDESVATVPQMETCYQQGWRGIFVVKAAIAGSPKHLRQFCQTYQIDAVFSSVFETAIGRQAALQLAAELSHPNRAIGFGVNHWFIEDDRTWLTDLWTHL